METKYNHKEAFCLMWYKCDCGHKERIWNSRDGVVPFSIVCPSCGGCLEHIFLDLDEVAPNHKLNEWQKFFKAKTMNEYGHKTKWIIVDTLNE